MSAQYDSIAEGYQATKQSPLRRHVEAYSFFSMLGNLEGLDILDLACGEGFYTRLMREAGAARVVGVDVSAEMIRLARELEAAKPLGLAYHCADAARLPELGLFDIVSAAYLLHYAENVNTLRMMCEQIAAHLKPGGRFVCINENPEQLFSAYAGYSQYGFNKSAAGSQVDAAPLTYAMISGRQMIRFNVYYYCRATYETALREAGFSQINWVPLKLSEQGIAECGEDYWHEYMTNPPVTGLVCVR